MLLIQLAPARELALTNTIRRGGHHVLLAASVSDALSVLRATVPDLLVLGTPTLEMSLLVRALERSYSRGMRPQIVTDTERTSSGLPPSWLELIDQP